jgi:putative transposase
MVMIHSAVVSIFAFRFRSRASLELKLIALQHQLAVLRRQRPGRPQLSSLDRLLDRRRVVHFEVTRNPTQVWLSGQMTEAFPSDTAPRYLLRDRDKSYGPAFRHRVRVMGITEVITAPRSPWQNPYFERLIGSIRRECLDHVIILSERHLRRVLSSYFQYHHEARTHLSLNKDCPWLRPVQLPSAGHNIIALPEVGGLHHRYERRAA